MSDYYERERDHRAESAELSRRFGELKRLVRALEPELRALADGGQEAAEALCREVGIGTRAQGRERLVKELRIASSNADCAQVALDEAVAAERRAQRALADHDVAGDG